MVNLGVVLRNRGGCVVLVEVFWRIERLWWGRVVFAPGVSVCVVESWAVQWLARGSMSFVV